MDKEEFRIKLEQINHLVEVKDYKGAMEVVDSIDWRRVKNVRTLCIVGEIYSANKRFDDAREIFLLAYHRSSIGKNILIRLFELSLKTGDLAEAEEYYEEFCSVAPNDHTAYVLQYRLLKANNAPLEDQIKVLEEYKQKEFTEKWSFELAKLYFENGQNDKAAALCDEMILWFSEGKYIMKAMDLKLRMGVMTDEEREAYEKKFIPKLHTAEDLKKKKEQEAKDETSSDEEGENTETVSDEEEKIREEIDEEASAAEEEIAEEVEKAKEETEVDSFDDAEDDDSEEDSEAVHIGKIKVRNSRELEEAETFQERISKGLRDLFGVRKKETSEEEDSSESIEEKEESFRSEIKIEDVPELEQEGEEKKSSVFDFGKGLSMPELKIPSSMRRKPEDLEEDPFGLEEPNDVLKKVSEESKSEEEEEEFNLEAAILAAATEQGIDIPKENEEDPDISEEEVSEEEIASEEEDASEETEEDAAESEDKQEQETESDNEPESLDESDFEAMISAAEDKTEETAENAAVEENQQDIGITEESEENFEAAPEITEEPEEAAVNDPNHGDLFIHGILDWEEVQGSKYKKSGMQPFRREKNGKKTVFIEEAKEKKNSVKAEETKQNHKNAKPLSEEEKIEQFIDSIQPKEDSRSEDIIPRENKLSAEEEKLFSYFVQVPGMKEQIIDALVNVQEEAASKTSKSGNVIVMGGPESGKTRLISALIPAICKELNLSASKVAYVFADQINGKNIDQIFRKLAGGFFVIEKANHLDQATVSKLEEAMDRNTGGMIVILEDDKIGMRKFVTRFPKLARKFTAVINIPVFTSDELAAFARVYATENGYRIDNMGMLALYNMIGMNQKEDMPMNIGAVKNMIDAAISKSQGGIFKKNSKKKKDRDGYIVLTEKDFNIK